jgi:hypothetical protein
VWVRLVRGSIRNQMYVYVCEQSIVCFCVSVSVRERARVCVGRRVMVVLMKRDGVDEEVDCNVVLCSATLTECLSCAQGG